MENIILVVKKLNHIIGQSKEVDNTWISALLVAMQGVKQAKKKII